MVGAEVLGAVVVAANIVATSVALSLGSGRVVGLMI